VRIALAVAVARLAPDSERFGVCRCLREARTSATNPRDVELFVLGSGITVRALRDHTGGLLEGWGDCSVRSIPENLGVPEALHALWEMSCTSGVDVVCYLHDDCFLYGRGWDESIRSVFSDPNVGLAGVSGARGLGLEALYHVPYDITLLLRLDFVSNLRSGGFGGGAERHGRRGLSPERIVVTDGASMFVRRELLDSIGGWRWWPFPHHNYDTALGCQVARAGLQAWYLPIESDHVSGFTANNEEGARLLRDAGGERQVHIQSARALYDQFRDVLPLRIR